MIQESHISVTQGLAELERRIAFFESELKDHPLIGLVKSGKIPPAVRKDFALYLFSDSWMWPSMLIAMRDRSRHPKLRRAVEDNIRDEAGERGDSHVGLCLRFLESLGVAPSLEEGPSLDRTVRISSTLSEAQIAGWLLTAERLTLPLFALARECFSSAPGAELEYLDVHLRVDEDHISWLKEAAEGILEEGGSLKAVLQGSGLAARATLDAMDQLFEKAASTEGLRHL
ncbi:MAG: iron-containing redox enzyme family protein [Elusimicrobia bacterium]|nr:iron-containing redox enzyme family protein [Elusimicrobiota bacterium]